MPIYSFEHRCVENLSLQLGDGIGTIMLNSKAKDAGSEELATFFDYINKQNVPKDDPLIEELHKKVKDFNKEKWRRMVRTLYDEIEDEKRFSFDAGKAEGKVEERKANILKMIDILKDLGLSNDEVSEKITLSFNLTKEEQNSILPRVNVKA